MIMDLDTRKTSKQQQTVQIETIFEHHSLITCIKYFENHNNENKRSSFKSISSLRTAKELSRFYLTSLFIFECQGF